MKRLNSFSALTFLLFCFGTLLFFEADVFAQDSGGKAQYSLAAPQEVVFGSEFTVGFSASGLEESLYDIKIDVVGGGERISKIFNAPEDKWQSTFNFLKNAFEGPQDEKEFKLLITAPEEFSGIADITARIREAGSSTSKVAAMGKITILMSESLNEEEDGEQASEGEEAEQGGQESGDEPGEENGGVLSDDGGGAKSEGGGSDVSGAISKALAYLKEQPESPDRAIALAAAGENPELSFLRSFSGESAISYAKPILAITATGQDPRKFPNEDFVEKMKGFADGIQLGDSALLNDDIWGILALRSAGISVSDPVVEGSKTFLLQNQNANGGWAWNVGGSSDTNDTAAAIMALVEVGMSKNDTEIQNAISYLRAAQNDDGGFPYDPESPFGTDSDGNSDAWIIMAITKVGQDSQSWTKSGKNPVEHLLSLQDEDGGFWWMKPPAAFNNKLPTADALIALMGKSFPVGVLPLFREVQEVEEKIESRGGPGMSVALSLPSGATMAEQGAEKVSQEIVRMEKSGQMLEVFSKVFVPKETKVVVKGEKGWTGEIAPKPAATLEEVRQSVQNTRTAQGTLLADLVPVGMVKVRVGEGVSLEFDKPVKVTIPVFAKEGAELAVFTRSELEDKFRYLADCQVFDSVCQVETTSLSWFVAVELREKSENLSVQLEELSRRLEEAKQQALALQAAIHALALSQEQNIVEQPKPEERKEEIALEQLQEPFLLQQKEEQEKLYGAIAAQALGAREGTPKSVFLGVALLTVFALGLVGILRLSRRARREAAKKHPHVSVDEGRRVLVSPSSAKPTNEKAQQVERKHHEKHGYHKEQSYQYNIQNTEQHDKDKDKNKDP